MKGFYPTRSNPLLAQLYTITDKLLDPIKRNNFREYIEHYEPIIQKLEHLKPLNESELKKLIKLDTSDRYKNLIYQLLFRQELVEKLNLSQAKELVETLFQNNDYNTDANRTEIIELVLETKAIKNLNVEELKELTKLINHDNNRFLIITEALAQGLIKPLNVSDSAKLTALVNNEGFKSKIIEFIELAKQNCSQFSSSSSQEAYDLASANAPASSSVITNDAEPLHHSAKRQRQS